MKLPVHRAIAEREKLALVRAVPFRAFIMLALLAVLTGCTTSRNPSQAVSPSIPSIFRDPLASSLGPNASKLRYSQLLAFKNVMLNFSVDPPLLIDFLIIQGSPPIERAEFWVDLINNDENTVEFRAFCLRLLFLRHLRVGESPQKFATLSGTDGWFDQETLIPMGSASALPLERTGFGYYAFGPHFDEKGEVTVYMQLSHDIDLDDLVAAMTGKKTNFNDLRVVDISVD